MSQDEQKASGIGDLAPSFTEYAGWFGHIVRFLCFSGSRSQHIKEPILFGAWAEQAIRDPYMNKKKIEYALECEKALLKEAQALMQKIAGSDTAYIDRASFDDFFNLYGSFMEAIQQLSINLAKIDMGLDPDTGLKNEIAMQEDINAELDRLSRKGSPFCLALARVDHYAEIKAGAEEEELKNLLSQITFMIRRSLRNFDDAFRLRNGDVVMSLKLTKTSGGVAAVNRIRSFLEKDDLKISVGKEMVPLTMSFCVAEPVPGDTIDELIENMRADLSSFENDTGATLEFIEKSPLQRYLSGE